MYYLHQSESEYVNAPLVSTPARNFSLSGGVNMIFTRTRDRPFFARKPCYLWRGPPTIPAIMFAIGTAARAALPRWLRAQGQAV